MRSTLKTLLLFTFLNCFLSYSQNGKIIEKERLILSDSTIAKIHKTDSTMMKALKEIEFFRITYLSDSLKIKGFIAKPIREGSFPFNLSSINI